MFSAEARRIFQYFNGQKLIYADPIEINRRVWHACGGDPKDLVEKAKVPDQIVAYEALEKFVGAIREAFRMPAINPDTGQGALFDEVLQAWEDFVGFFLHVGQRPAGSPTSLAGSQVQARSSIPASPAPPPMKPTAPLSDCGC